jgi:Icc-related predicted phosphoesterase
MDAEDCSKQTTNVCDAAVDVLLVAGDICGLYVTQWFYKGCRVLLNVNLPFSN